MTVQRSAVLTLPPPGNVGGKTIDKRPRFEFSGGVSITQGLRTDFLLGSGGDKTINTILNSDFISDDDSKYKKLHVNTATGTRTVQIEFRNWTGSDKAWGDPDSTDPPYQGKGADALTQLQILEYYLAIAAPDSLAPAQLEVGGYAPGEMFDTALGKDHLDVVVEQPEVDWTPRNNESAATISGSLTCVETVTGSLAGVAQDTFETVADASTRIWRDQP